MTDGEISLNEVVLYNFNAVSRIMEQYIRHFYEKHKNETTQPLLTFNERNIDKFKSNVKKQAKKITDKMKPPCTPDRHKIIAACLKSFISANIFCFDYKSFEVSLSKCECCDESLTLYTIYPNEMFCIEMIKIILDYYSRYKNIDDYRLEYANNIVGLDQMSHHYIVDLFKLILGYERKSLDFVVQELAHIIFFIEMGYEVSIKGLSHMYYKNI